MFCCLSEVFLSIAEVAESPPGRIGPQVQGQGCLEALFRPYVVIIIGVLVTAEGVGVRVAGIQLYRAVEEL